MNRWKPALIAAGTIERFASPAEEIAIAVLEESAVAMAVVNHDLGWSITRSSDREKVTELRDVVVEDTDIEILWGPKIMPRYGGASDLRVGRVI